jgi:hypothetical protein
LANKSELRGSIAALMMLIALPAPFTPGTDRKFGLLAISYSYRMAHLALESAVGFEGTPIKTLDGTIALSC